MFLAITALVVGGSAATFTVNSSDSAATIQTAITNAMASADPSDEVVFNAGTYVLSASLTVDMSASGAIIVRGASSANRPIIVCPNYTGGTSTDGAFSIGGTGMTLTIQDMIILPPAIGGGGPTNANTIGIGGKASLASCTLNFVNLLLTGNNGSNAPTSLDGLRDPAADAGVMSRFDNACMNLIPTAGNAATIVVGATDVICSQALAEGFYMDGSNATVGGCLKAHFYNCLFSWNEADGFRFVRIGKDDRWYGCRFLYNGNGTSANQGIHNSGWNPGGVFDGNGGSSVFDNCEASYNVDRGFYIGASENTLVADCTAMDNGNFFPVAATDTRGNTAFGLEWVTGQGHYSLDGAYCSGNRGGAVSVNIQGSAGSTIAVRHVTSLSNGVNNNSGVTDAFTGKSAVRCGGVQTIIEDIFVDNCPAIGVWRDCGASVASSDVQIRRCTVNNCGMSGMLVWDTGANSTAVLEDLTLNNTSNNPLAITNSANRGNGVVMRSNTAGTRVGGMRAGSTCTITNVTIDGARMGTIDSTGDGLRVESENAPGGQLNVTDVTVHNTENAGMSLAGGIVAVTNADVNGAAAGSGIQIIAAAPLSVSDAVVRNCSPHGITMGHEGVTAPSVPLTISLINHVAVVSNYDSGIRILSNAVSSPTWTLSNSTLLMNPIGIKVEVPGGVSQPIEVSDTIIAATAGTGVRVATTLTSPILVHNVGLVQEAPYALTTPVSDVNGPSIVQTSLIVTRDPIFVSVAETDPGFLDVRSNAYGGQGTGGSDLSGYGDYIGDINSIEGWRRF